MESIIYRSNAPRRLLLAFAHPDDESFGPAGTIIHYARQGVAVHYACATRGEAGSVDPQLLAGYDSLADLRTIEMRCAAQPLGLTGLHILDYRDSGMENTADNQNPASLFQAPLEDVAEKLACLIRRIRPQVVVTFDPSGGYFHPDHVKMHQATTLAFHTAGDAQHYTRQISEGLAPYQPQKLYYTAFPRAWVRLLIKIMPLLGQNPAAFGRNKDINLQRIAQVEQTVTTRIAVKPYYDNVQQAVRCYVSQLGHARRWPKFLDRWMFRHDAYTRIVPPAHDGQLEHDLFAGVTTPGEGPA